MLFDECPVCQEFLPETEFRLCRRGRKENMIVGRKEYCRRCEKKYKSDFLYPAKTTIAGHGMTLDDYDRLVIKQDDKCAICKKDWWNVGRALFIDHDHKCCPGATSCGKCVRGLLCNSCNYGIGIFKDNVSSLRNAADYLESTTSSGPVEPWWNI